MYQRKVNQNKETGIKSQFKSIRNYSHQYLWVIFTKWFEVLHIFIGDLRYGYIFLIVDKSSSPDVFKISKIEVENQLEKKIKVIRYDRGCEYMGDMMKVVNSWGFLRVTYKIAKL